MMMKMMVTRIMITIIEYYYETLDLIHTVAADDDDYDEVDDNTND